MSTILGVEKGVLSVTREWMRNVALELAIRDGGAVAVFVLVR